MIVIVATPIPAMRKITNPRDTDIRNGETVNSICITFMTPVVICPYYYPVVNYKYSSRFIAESV